MKVIKRDGTPQEYSFIKIADAIRKEAVPAKFYSNQKK